jgi:hypothetical protein
MLWVLDGATSLKHLVVFLVTAFLSLVQRRWAMASASVPAEIDVSSIVLSGLLNSTISAVYCFLAVVVLIAASSPRASPLS